MLMNKLYLRSGDAKSAPRSPSRRSTLSRGRCCSAPATNQTRACGRKWAAQRPGWCGAITSLTLRLALGGTEEGVRVEAGEGANGENGVSVRG